MVAVSAAMCLVVVALLPFACRYWDMSFRIDAIRDNAGKVIRVWLWKWHSVRAISSKKFNQGRGG